MVKPTSHRSERSVYLEEKVSAIIGLVDEGYGKALIDQLIGRLETTVNKFVAELDGLLDVLKENAAAQEELLGRIQKRDLVSGQYGDLTQDIADEEITEWEKRLARLEESGD